MTEGSNDRKAGSGNDDGRSPSGSEGGLWTRVITWIACRWDVAEDIGYVAKLTRFSGLVLVIGAFVFCVTDQGQDMLITLTEDPGLAPGFHAAVWLWALSTWYWARLILAATPDRDRPETCPQHKRIFGGRTARVKFLVKAVPRILGTLAFVAVAVALFRAGSVLHGAIVLAFGLLVFLPFFIFRRDLVKHLRKWLEAKEAAWARIVIGLLEIPGEPGRTQKGGALRDLPVMSRFLIVASVLLWLALMILSSRDPMALAFLGPAVVILVAIALWVPIGTSLLYVSRKGDAPILTLLLAWALLASLWNDNHQLRLAEKQPRTADRESLREAYETWHSNAPGGTPNLVLVATAGGGSRAAYWTGAVLGTIRDQHADFDRNLFGLSGVSGGAVGATVYRALLSELRDAEETLNCGTDDGRPMPGGPIATCALKILGQDFLGPTLAGMLFPDLLQRFSPTWGSWTLPDRARALETTWEQAWCDALTGPDEDGDRCSDGGRLAGPFLDLWAPASGHEPALFLNGTSIKSGRRIVTSNLDLNGVLIDGYDLFTHWPLPSLRVSTAANNAARFPYIEPAGTLHGGKTADKIVDGGYFENFGASTAEDLLKALSSYVADGATSLSSRPVIIQISSDPEYPGVDAASEAAPESDLGDFGSEAWAPPLVLLNTRSARGRLAAASLAQWVKGHKVEGLYVPFQLYPVDGADDPPLGWTLSERAKQLMECQLLHPNNCQSMAILADTLGFSEPVYPDDFKDFCRTNFGIETP